MLSIGNPSIDWVAMARSMGVEATRATDCTELAKSLDAGLASQGPYLIEVAL
jgi:acetolactate synthase-1/2/3 large subunit